MQRLVVVEYLVLTLLVLILIMQQSYRLSLNSSTFAISSFSSSSASSSPSFVRQEIIDAADDWQFWKGSSNISTIRGHDGHSIQIENANNITQCKIGDKFYLTRFTIS
jgi:hypothetical protein